MKLALFDFCETLVNFQTADYFVEYTLRMYGRNSRYEKLIGNRLIAKYLNKNWELKKKLHLYFLKGLNEEELGLAAIEYYRKYVHPNLFEYMIELIRDYQRRGYNIYVISGGYSIYIKQYVKEYKLDGVIANDFVYKTRRGKKIFAGYLRGNDCMGHEKVKRLNQFFKVDEITESVSYSDSLSDLPLLRWTQRGVLVSKYNERKSAKENCLEQIVLANLESENTKFEFGGIKEF